MQANDLLSCKVSLSIDESSQNQSPPISPKTTIRSWESWDTISIPKEILKNRRRRDSELRRKAEARAEAELWAEVQRSRYGATQGTEHTPISKQPEVSHMKTTAVANASEEFDWMPYMLMYFNSKYQTVMHGFESMNAKRNEVLDSIEEAYDEDVTDELSEEECGKLYPMDQCQLPSPTPEHLQAVVNRQYMTAEGTRQIMIHS